MSKLIKELVKKSKATRLVVHSEKTEQDRLSVGGLILSFLRHQEPLFVPAVCVEILDNISKGIFDGKKISKAQIAILEAIRDGKVTTISSSKLGEQFKSITLRQGSKALETTIKSRKKKTADLRDLYQAGVASATHKGKTYKGLYISRKETPSIKGNKKPDQWEA